jgi:hypothetical protein
MELDWFRSPPTQGQTLAVDLVLQEMAYPHVPSAGSPGELDWRSLPEGKRQWKVDVESLGAQHRLIHEVEILQQGDRCEGIVRRRRGSDGVAHRFILKERGLVAWSWRMRWKDEVLEGQWVRYAQRGTAQIQLKLSGGVLWRQEVECPADLTLLPALEIPSLRAFEGYPKVMPLTGRICPPLNFPTSQVLENDGVYYRVMGLQGKWKERWTQVQLP